MADNDTLDITSGSEQPAPRRRGRKPGSVNKSKTATSSKKTPTKAQIEAVHEKVSIGVIAATANLPDAVRPTDEEIDSILLPLENIIGRRVNVGAVIENPDATDALKALAGLGQYTWRTTVYPLLMGKVMTANRRRHMQREAAAAQAAPRPTPQRDAVNQVLFNEQPTVAGKPVDPEKAATTQKARAAAPPIDPTLSEEEQAEQLLRILQETDKNGKPT